MAEETRRRGRRSLSRSPNLSGPRAGLTLETPHLIDDTPSEQLLHLCARRTRREREVNMTGPVRGSIFTAGFRTAYTALISPSSATASRACMKLVQSIRLDSWNCGRRRGRSVYLRNGQWGWCGRGRTEGGRSCQRWWGGKWKGRRRRGWRRSKFGGPARRRWAGMAHREEGCLLRGRGGGMGGRERRMRLRRRRDRRRRWRRRQLWPPRRGPDDAW